MISFVHFRSLFFASIFGVTLLDASGLVWPTPNPAFQRGQSIRAFVQPTSSGVAESGLFGCVRNSGHKFHEGLDLYPIRRDKKGEAMDDVYAILPGRVVYISRTAGHSSYGRYVVVVHDQEAVPFHSLYAHLAKVPEDIQVGVAVESGTVLGRMGRSAGGYTIPRSRAHLHLEIGFRITDDFQAWYDRQQYGSPNRHGIWNGVNLLGIDPLDFYEKMRSGRANSLHDYIRKLPVAARIRVHTSVVPSFLRNYEALMERPLDGRELVAWDVAFTSHGLPKAWTPRFRDEGLGGQVGDVKVLAYDPRFVDEQKCQRVLNPGSKAPMISSATLSTIKKLFGFK